MNTNPRSNITPKHYASLCSGQRGRPLLELSAALRAHKIDARYGGPDKHLAVIRVPPEQLDAAVKRRDRYLDDHPLLCVHDVR